MKTGLNIIISGIITLSAASFWPLAACGVENISPTGHDDHQSHLDHPEDEEEQHEQNEAETQEAHVDHLEHGHAEDGHGESEDGWNGVHLTARERELFEIEMHSAGSGSLIEEVSMPGEIVFNQDRLVHIAPIVAGTVTKVYKNLGDEVLQGDVLAVIESLELADAKSDFLAWQARVKLADKNYEREKALYGKDATSEQELLQSEAKMSEARIALLSARQKLRALGISREAIEKMSDEDGEELTRYEIISPQSGVIVKRDIVRGESLAGHTEIYTVADLSAVWARLSVYAKDLAAVKEGGEVVLRSYQGGVEGSSQVAMVTPFVDSASRSAIARVILKNPDRKWIPGTFVTGFVKSADRELPVTVELEAVQRIDGNEVVFVEEAEYFKPKIVVTGRKDRYRVEIISGLEPGAVYVAKGAFELKATLVTSGMGAHAGHGH